MKQIQELIRQAELGQATEAAVTALREDPADAAIRACYIELLCVQGALEKADHQLDILVRQHPDYLVGAVNLRQLIRAATARQDFYQGGMTATLFSESDTAFQTLVSLHLALREQNYAMAAGAAVELENLRPKTEVALAQTEVADLRDLDDSLCGYLELFGTDGKFYLATFEQIERLQLMAPSSLLDTVWRRAEIIIKNGPSGEVFVPVTYHGSVRMSERLGRDTQWCEHHPQLVTGLGQKMLLAGDEAIALSSVSLLCAAPEEVTA